jgi:hypothetical protein
MSDNQTAVEWLIEQTMYIRSTKWPDIIEQAKAMEKEQIILANEDCSTNELGEFISGEQYYNETYGK